MKNRFRGLSEKDGRPVIRARSRPSAHLTLLFTDEGAAKPEGSGKGDGGPRGCGGRRPNGRSLLESQERN